MSSGPTKFEISKDSRSFHRSSSTQYGVQSRNSSVEASKRFSDKNSAGSGKKERRVPPIVGASRRGGGPEERAYEARDVDRGQRSDVIEVDPVGMTTSSATLNPNAAEWNPAASGHAGTDSVASVLSDHEIAINTEATSSQTTDAGHSFEGHRRHDKVQETRGASRRRGRALSAAFNRQGASSGHEVSAETRLGGSLYASGPPSKRGAAGNANHLLNFHYEPLQRGSSGGRRQARAPLQPFNREVFLQANFRFLVSAMADYSAHLRDPDRILDWTQVAAVEVDLPAPPQCPICLETPPLCPVITACGHLFCFPCVVRYLVREGREWKKCPLCFAMIGTEDLRSVTVRTARLPQEGDVMHFSLLVRSKESTIPFLRSALNAGSALDSVAYSGGGGCYPFSTFSLLREKEAQAASEAVEGELMSWAQAAQKGGCSEEVDHVPFVLTCAHLVKERKEAWTRRGEERFLTTPPSTQKRLLAQAREAHGVGRVNERAPSSRVGPDVSAEADAEMARLNAGSGWEYTPAFSDEEEGPDQRSRRREEGRSKKAAGGGREGGSGKKGWEDEGGEGGTRGYYMFYQLSDGRLGVLHPLTMRCLLHHYGAYHLLPHTLESRVVGVEAERQSESSRKRYRFLSHIPLTASFLVVELDLAPLLPEAAMAPFKAELQQRERRRQVQKQKDLEETKRAEEADARFCAGPFVPASEDFSAILAALEEDEVVPPVFPPHSPPDASTLSFSRVAKMGYASGLNAPELPHGPLVGASPPTRVPWGPSGWGGGGSPSSSLESDFTPPPPRSAQLSFASVMEGAQSEEKVVESEGRGKGKKKGKKGTTMLMSTSARRL